MPEFPTDKQNGSFLFPGGYIENADLSSYRPITSHSDEYLIKGIQESAKHLGMNTKRHRRRGKAYHHSGFMMVGLTTGNIPVKSPTFYGKTVEVGSAG